jgi:predicted Zn-dependent peptidase
MAHFLEHLVFKGGEKFDDYRKVNETAERMGGSLNAYTSHDLVAFHITVRSESTMEALDLLTDFVGRPKIDQAELDKERGVVIQEIARYKDQPAAVAEELIDRAAFGDHPFGRTVLGPKEHLETFSRDAIIAFRERRWAGRARRARSSSATRSTRATTPRWASCSSASRRSTSPGPTSPPRRHSSRRSSWSSATRTSRTCG